MEYKQRHSRTTILSGVLTKCGTQRHTWKQRYFHLVDEKLSYFDDSGRRSKFRGSMSICNHSISVLPCALNKDGRLKMIKINRHPLSDETSITRGVMQKLKGFISTKVCKKNTAAQANAIRLYLVFRFFHI